ncbi:hypothetical protein CRE_21039 [Caenorhabditis remanei]|uniref:SCP domain-containing protein n=1 Tax=Caenorhabditis remanei TaxID=31234 RepID=E3NNR1_CAERE|nr:hypothetical protein CRE_21039 [Caenorhabditis remanei]
MINQVGLFREYYAKAAQVSNMNELIYDYQLEKVARKYNSCHLDQDTWKRLEREPHYYLYKEQLENDFVEYAALHRNDTKGIKGYFGNEDMFSAVLHPKVEKLGCHYFFSLCVHKIWSRADVFTDVKRSTVRGLCIFGPKDRLTPNATLYGKPGSRCSGKLTNGGLCNVPRENYYYF